jgi:hypothetical protein
LPTELHVPFDTAFLAPIPEFSDEEHFLRELSKVTKKIKAAALKKRLTRLAGLIKEAEDQQNTEALKAHQEQFDKLSKLLGSAY